MENIIIISVIFFSIFFVFNNNKIANLLNIYDDPDNFRKIHKSKVPLTGGIILVLNIIILFLLLISCNE